MPRVGQKVLVRGVTCIIRIIHAAGTVDVEAPDGSWYRVSGLPFVTN